MDDDFEKFLAGLKSELADEPKPETARRERQPVERTPVRPSVVAETREYEDFVQEDKPSPVLRVIAIVLGVVALALAVFMGIMVLRGRSADTVQAPAAEKVPIEETTQPTEAPAEMETVPAEEPQQGGVEVDAGLFNVTLTIPAEFIEGTTQEDLDAAVAQNGYKSATLNPDGSATYVMTKSQHKDLMDGMAENVRAGLDDLLATEGIEHFTRIEPNKDFTEFTVYMNGDETNLVEDFALLSLYLYGGMYNAFNGTPADNIHVQYINEATGDVVQEANSRDLAE